MLLATNARPIPIAADCPDMLDEGWMLVADQERVDSVGSGTPPRVEADAKVRGQLPALAAQHGWPA